MKTTLYCPDIECESCEKRIKKALGKHSGIKSFNIENTTIHVTHDSSVKKADIEKIIKEKGYRVYDKPYNRKPISARMKEFTSNKKKYDHEHRFLKYVGATFVFILLLQGLYQYFTHGMVLAGNSMWMFYLTLIVVSLTGAIWHFKSYRGQVTAMVGMMIGMTIGMQTGLMLGILFASTNGFLIGAILAMLIASIVGAYTGYCCGIIGVMEGVMAGTMGGTMGAMLGAMLMSDVVWFMPPFMLLNLIVLAGMVYLVFEEVVEDKEAVIKQPPNFLKFFLYSALAVIILTLTINVLPTTSMDMQMNGMDMEDSMGNDMEDMSTKEMNDLPCHQMPDGTWMGKCEDKDNMMDMSQK